MFSLKNKSFGFGLLEVVIASAIITVSLGVLILSFVNTLAMEENSLRRNQAAFLAEEAVEILRYLRSESWENVNTPGVYQAVCQLSECFLVPDNNLLINDIFYRVINIQPAYRNQNNQLSDSGVLEEEAIFVEVSVSWSGRGGMRTEILKTYLTDIFDN